MLRYLVAAVLLTALSATAQVTLPDAFRFLATHKLFERIRADPGFDLDKPATFGFFFNSKDQEAITRVRASMLEAGYVFASEHTNRDGTIVLQVTKIETHTVDSMVERNRQLFASAAASGAVRYTGWDVARNAR